MMNWKMKLLSLILSTGAVTALNAQTESKNLSGISVENMNLNVKPGTDFYQYACGGWLKAHPLTAEYAQFGTFDLLMENNNKRQQQLIEELIKSKAAAGSLEDKIARLYLSAMDSTARNKAGWQPIRPYMEGITKCQNKEELMNQVARMQRLGMPAFFYFFIGADIKNSSMNLVQLYQGGTCLGEREYYLDEDEVTKNIREAYQKYMKEMLAYCGYKKEADQMVADIMRIETRLAKASYNATQQRDPEANYHKMSFDNLKKDYPGIDWSNYFHIIGMDGITDINVAQPEAIHEVEAVLKEESLNSLQSFMLWKLIDSSASYLDDSMRAIYFSFYGKVLSGSEQDRPRWKRALGVVESNLGEAMGRLYVERYFPQAAKERMVKLIKNLQTALAERIKEQDWMSESTKTAALDKLNAFHVKVGYPDKWRDYSALKIGDTLLENIVNCSEFDVQNMIKEKLNKPVDSDEWHMTPQTVNAYYNPTTNEICFPAGILQYPFFDMNNDDAFNYGAIGVVIGHEMTHGFDDKGRQFDKHGNLTDWWAPGDAERFVQRAEVMKNYFNQIEVLPGLKANGELTLGENLADHGGLKVALLAFHNATRENPLPIKDNFTPEQRFFLAYANLWATNVREEQIRKLTKSDPHSLDKWRVNGALPHIDAWYKAFGITDKDSLFLPENERLKLW